MRWIVAGSPLRQDARWLFTLASVFAWAAFDRDWGRVSIVLLPFFVTVILDFVAAARLSETFTGNDRALVVYLGSLAALAAVFSRAWLAQRQARDGVVTAVEVP